jgi:hypothetical protein
MKKCLVAVSLIAFRSREHVPFQIAHLAWCFSTGYRRAVQRDIQGAALHQLGVRADVNGCPGGASSR